MEQVVIQVRRINNFHFHINQAGDQTLAYFLTKEVLLSRKKDLERKKKDKEIRKKKNKK